MPGKVNVTLMSNDNVQVRSDMCGEAVVPVEFSNAELAFLDFIDGSGKIYSLMEKFAKAGYELAKKVK